ncbi:uncharacterized protein LY79DRAFT_565783 [Colletotrichum navitas]|uniref:Uncharacterized protein n=1 Tax=Colletotrichum navitas TaxID=681940 RepID=A0AAD8PQQ1_9PEZI|nr:uncharacterized protein LY79DRAFT_565783 [Colletotrichum navitas]KAK1574516.1 hypothetical protein LY79DRAFT_565783 [Colletotrichum navitas]
MLLPTNIGRFYHSESRTTRLQPALSVMEVTVNHSAYPNDPKAPWIKFLVFCSSLLQRLARIRSIHRFLTDQDLTTLRCSMKL